MNIRFEAVTNVEQEAAAARVRREVFGTNWAVELCRILPGERSRSNHLIARLLPEDKVIATVTLLDTSGNQAMHAKYDLPFANSDRVARYTHMAVLKPYHGLKLPLYLLVEATRLFVAPGSFDYTWLAFPSDRAASTTFCRMLRFSAAPRVIECDHGRCRVLRRKEGTAEASAADANIRAFLEAVQPARLRIQPSSQPAPRSFSPSSAGTSGSPNSSLCIAFR